MMSGEWVAWEGPPSAAPSPDDDHGNAPETLSKYWPQAWTVTHIQLTPHSSLSINIPNPGNYSD